MAYMTIEELRHRAGLADREQYNAKVRGDQREQDYYRGKRDAFREIASHIEREGHIPPGVRHA